jgi:hypothetical protein
MGRSQVVRKRLRPDRWMMAVALSRMQHLRLENYSSAHKRIHPTNACSGCMSSAFLLPYGTESRTRRGLAMTVHGTLLRRKSAVDAVDAGIIASPARRCIGTCIIIVAYRRSAGGGCGWSGERASVR